MLILRRLLLGATFALTLHCLSFAQQLVVTVNVANPMPSLLSEW